MPPYRRKMPTIEARQWDGENANEIVRWAQGDWKDGGIWLRQKWRDGQPVWSLMLPDDSEVFAGDWVIATVDGRIFGVSAEAFAKTYEEVPENPSP